MALVGRSQFAFESIGQVLDRAESESSYSASASSDDSRQSSELGTGRSKSSRPSSMKPCSSSKKDRSRRDSRPYSVRFDDEVVMMGDVEVVEVVGGGSGEREEKVPSPEKAIVPVQRMAEMREVGPVFRPLPMSLFQLWESQAQFTAIMQMQMQVQVHQHHQRQQQQQMLLLPPWAVMQNPWMMGQQQQMMMMTPMTSPNSTPLGSFAYCHPSFNPLTTHGVAMTAAQQTYQTAFAQQLLRYTCAGPGSGVPQAQGAMMMNMMPAFNYGWQNPYGVPFPLMPAPVYGKGNLP